MTSAATPPGPTLTPPAPPCAVTTASCGCKPLPGGAQFNLDDTTPGEYLHHRSDLGEFFLSSDSVIPDYKGHASTRSFSDQLADADVESFIATGYTMGGMMVFPSNRVDGRMTINGARGLCRKIADRFDLTLECIRRHYAGEPSPLADVLARYTDFFHLFEDFGGYVHFFLLNDLVENDYSNVTFFLPFDDFQTPATPTDAAAYREYARLSIEFITARNHRIDEWASRAD